MERILLDPYGDADLPIDYKIIQTEVAFLENALSHEQLIIRGDLLCKWAETFFKGRRIAFGYARSIVRELLTTFSFLNRVAANSIFALLNKNAHSDISMTAKGVLNGCFPNPIWDDTPSKEHAAKWLLWVEETKPDKLFEPFLIAIRSMWIDIFPDFKIAYDCINPQDASDLIMKWICYSDENAIKLLGSFPLSLSKKWNAVKLGFWENEIIESNGKFLLNFLQHESNHSDKLILVSKSIEYFRHNPEEIDWPIFNVLNQYAVGKEQVTLHKIKPVPAPGNLPDDPEGVQRWFKQEYLPYRQRAINVNDPAAKRQSIESARQFAEWYLKYYPKAIVKGKFLAPFLTKGIKEKNNHYITLLVILDGLNATDGQILLNSILSNNTRSQLDLVESTYSFSLLPTVTEFTKKYMLHGTIGRDFEKLEKIGIDTSDNKTPSNDLANAQPAEIIIWRIQEPDFTYHKEGQYADLPTKISGQMMIISERIREAIEAASVYHPLRIIITTDHGRLLGKSLRNIPVPDGMVAHGRAAWGVKDMKFSSDGYLINENVVFLSKETFHLDNQTAAVILSDQSFINETYKEELSPHGGLFPEEVLVPWMVFEKNLELPTFIISISGSGQANKPSKALLSITNLSSYNANLISIVFDLGTHQEKHEMDTPILPKKKNEYEILVKSWPSVDQAQSGSLKVEISLPNGEILFSSISLKDLNSESMYHIDNILEDLL